MFKSKTTKEKYNTFLNTIVTQLISGLVGLTLLATPLTEGLGSAQIYALFASLSLIILSYHQLPPTEVGGLFLSSVVKRLKADSLPKDSVLRPYTFYTLK